MCNHAGIHSADVPADPRTITPPAANANVSFLHKKESECSGVPMSDKLPRVLGG